MLLLHRQILPLVLSLSLLAAGCPRRGATRPQDGATPGLPDPGAENRGELAALLAAERALRAEQGERLWALWVQGEPGATAAASARYPALTSPATFRRLATLRSVLPAQAHTIDHLSRAVLGAHLAAATREVDARIATLQATATLELEGASLPYHALGRLLARESDARRRLRLRAAAGEIEAQLVVLFEQREARLADGAAACGLTPRAARALILPAPESTLAQAARHLLAADATDLRAQLDALARDRSGGPASELPADALARLFAPAPGEDEDFPATRLLDDLDRLLAALPPKAGPDTWHPRPDLAASASTLAVGTEPKQAPLPLCLPVAPPTDLRLSIAPRAGLRARLDALHEAVVCQALSALDVGTDPLDPEITLDAEVLAHRALHQGLEASGAGAFPGADALLARREGLRLRSEARRDAALLLSVLDDPGTAAETPEALFVRALPLKPPSEDAAAFERAFARAHLAILAARVLGTARAHGFGPPDQS